MLTFAQSLLYQILFRPLCWGCENSLKGAEKDFCFACRRCLLAPEVSPTHLLPLAGPVKPLLRALRGEAYFLGARWCESLLARRGLLAEWRSAGITLVTLAPRAKPRREDGLPILASAIAAAIGARFKETLRKSGGRSQHGRALGERMDTAPFVELSPAADLRGERVLLLDDVDTTGTTRELGAYRLREAGAASVLVYSVARQMVEGLERKREEAEDESEEVEPLLLHLLV